MGLTSILTQLSGSIALRGIVALIGVIAMRLSFSVLSDEGFYLFSLGLFHVALAIAFCSPINRRFWAYFEPDSTWNAVIGGAVISVLVIMSAFVTAALSGFVAELWSAIILGISFSIYAASRLLERYSYGTFVISGRMAMGLMVSVAYGVMEAATLLAMLAVHSDSLLTRILAPSFAFVTGVACLGAVLRGYRRPDLPGVCKRIARALKASRQTMVSSTALWVLFINVAMTFTSMGDRLLVGYQCSLSADVACPSTNSFLLLLAYAVALQSLLNVVVDWARPRIYYNDEAPPGGAQAAIGAIAAMIACGGGAIVASPLLEFIQILPPGFDPFLWTSLVIRSICISIVAVTQVDLVNRGHLKGASIVWATLSVALAFGYGLGGQGLTLTHIQMLVVPMFMAAAIISFLLFRGRLRQYQDILT